MFKKLSSVLTIRWRVRCTIRIRDIWVVQSVQMFVASSNGRGFAGLIGKLRMAAVVPELCRASETRQDVFLPRVSGRSSLCICSRAQAALGFSGLQFEYRKEKGARWMEFATSAQDERKRARSDARDLPAIDAANFLCCTFPNFLDCLIDVKCPRLGDDRRVRELLRSEVVLGKSAGGVRDGGSIDCSTSLEMTQHCFTLRLWDASGFFSRICCDANSAKRMSENELVAGLSEISLGCESWGKRAIVMASDDHFCVIFVIYEEVLGGKELDENAQYRRSGGWANFSGRARLLLYECGSEIVSLIF